MIEIKALCAICGPGLYYEEQPLRYFADGQWVECISLGEAVELATAGVGLKTIYGMVIHPAAAFLVNGTALCGYCVRSLTPADAVRNQLLQQHPWGNNPRYR
jgi:hypothetical protein